MSMKPNLPSSIACAPMNLYRHLDAFMELIFYFWLKLPCDYNTMLVPSLAVVSALVYSKSKLFPACHFKLYVCLILEYLMA